METDKVRYIVDEKGERTAVVLPINEYKELLEDLHDLVVIAERREEPTVPFGELKKAEKRWALMRFNGNDRRKVSFERLIPNGFLGSFRRWTH